jgi:putative DNA primase/helicase
MYLADGLGTCAAVDTATTAYHDDEDFIGQFIEECCIVGEGWSVSKADFRAALGAWMEAQGYKTPTERAVKSDMISRKFAEARPDRLGPWQWSGIALRNPVTQPQQSRGWHGDD